MRTYELVFLTDFRLSDEEVVGLADQYKEMITSAGARIVQEESWGKRPLAYPINKLNEAKYHLIRIETDGDYPLTEVEQRMRQNDQILRFLSVRSDSGRRHGTKTVAPVDLSSPTPESESSAESGDTDKEVSE